MKRTFLCLMALALLVTTTSAQTVNFWRGPNRDGKYPEKNLLKVWPEAGPTLKWSYETLGKGYTSPSVQGDKLYVTGLEGNSGFLHIFSLDGKLLKKIEYGPDVIASFPGPRSSPLLDGNLCYLLTGMGKLVCINTETEKVTWSKDMFTDFDGKNIRFNITENMLIDGDKLFVSPGGVKNNIVALNKKTGDVIWSSAGKGDNSAYCSPLLITHNGKRMLIQMMALNVVAVDPANGTLLWSFPYKNSNSIHPNTPIYEKGELYVFSGYGMGGVKLAINAEGTGVTKLWANTMQDNQMGGVILKNGFLYGSGDRNRKWFVLDWATGEVKYTAVDATTNAALLDKGTVIEADDMLYAYTDKGELALLQPETGSFKVASKFMITKGSAEHWAHLVINKGILFVRHGNALMAFDVKK